MAGLFVGRAQTQATSCSVQSSKLNSNAGRQKSSITPCSYTAQATRKNVKLTPLHHSFGVQISGIDLKQPIDAEDREIINAAMDEHDGVLFRGQALTPADEQRLLLSLPHDAQAVKEQRWENPFFKLRPPDNPLISVRPFNLVLKDHFGVSTEDYGPGKPNANTMPFKTGHLWHMDVIEKLNMPYISSMYMHIVPDVGGETLFAHTPSFLDSLPADELQFLESLKMCSLRQVLPPELAAAPREVNYEGTARADDVEAMVEGAKAAGTFKEPTESMFNPLIIQDKRTGKKSMVLSPWVVYCFQGMSSHDSRQLAKELCERCCTPERVYRHKWQAQDFFLWANRRMIHTNTPIDDSLGQPRLFHLVFLNSDDPMLPARQAV